MKLSIIGYSGAGKSTLALELGRRLGLPLLHLDRVQFTANWQERSRTEAQAMVESFLERESWVIDGTYPSFHYSRRLAESDKIIFLDFPRFACLRQAVGRYLRHRGRARESMAEGCREKMDWEFLRWLLWEGRSVERREAFRQVCAQYPEKVIILKSRAETRRFLDGFLA